MFRNQFLSTLSLRRATRRHRGNDRSPVHFYPRSPCGERLHASMHNIDIKNFYPRSPCGERRRAVYLEILSGIFLSTLSLRRATKCLVKARANPEFLSTLSLRRATSGHPETRLPDAISIHALLAESDGGNESSEDANNSDFYPRSPCGERLWPGLLARPFFLISIHALLAESDERAEHHANSQQEFLSTLSLRRATMIHMQKFCVLIFLSTLSLRRATNCSF